MALLFRLAFVAIGLSLGPLSPAADASPTREFPDSAYLKFAPTNTPWFLQVALKPTLTSVTQTSDVTAGITFGENAGGRYFIGLQAIKVPEGMAEVLMGRDPGARSAFPGRASSFPGIRPCPELPEAFQKVLTP